MPRDGRTGLVIPVPAADAVLAPVAQRYPDAVRPGVPAHISLLYPFLPQSELDETVTAALHTICAEQTPMVVRFARCCRSGGFVSLRPEPPAELETLTSAVRQRWPEVVPYEGRYGEVEPHVTAALGTSEETAAAIEGHVGARLPIPAQLREAWLVVFTGQWSLRQRFPFGQ